MRNLNHECLYRAELLSQPWLGGTSSQNEYSNNSDSQWQPQTESEKGILKMARQGQQHRVMLHNPPRLKQVNNTTDADPHRAPSAHAGTPPVLIRQEGGGQTRSDEGQMHKAPLACSRTIEGETMLVAKDNSTVLSYLKKQGGTKSHTLMFLMKQVFSPPQELKCTILCRHIPGTKPCK